MITAAQESYIAQNAYVPEHIYRYVTAISPSEPHLFGEFIAYAAKDRLIFVGYPLQGPFQEKQLNKALEKALRHLLPESVSLIAPSIPPSIDKSVHPADYYYSLDLSSLRVSQKLRNMLTRADREVTVREGAPFGEEHRKMVEGFLKSRPVGEGTGFIMRRIDAYLAASARASLFEARDGRGELVAFDIAEFLPKDTALYMFNFRAPDRYIPGASDLLLAELIRRAKEEGKGRINLGLGINPGVTYFKTKWGGAPFVPHASCLYHPARKESLDDLFQKL